MPLYTARILAVGRREFRMTLMRTALHSFAYSLDYLREQLADVPDGRLADLPAGLANHPAWTVGHLTLTCQQLAGAIGVPAWLPEAFERQFGTGSVPAVGQPFEPKPAALARLVDAQARLTAAVERLDDARLDQPFPDPSLRDVVPTLRHAITQVLVGHTAYHLGQVAAWRRAMGLPALRRAYE